MSLHFGPEWSWDQTRPEAIEARHQMELFFKGCPSFQITSQTNSRRVGKRENLRVTRFLGFVSCFLGMGARSDSFHGMPHGRSGR